MLGCIPNALFLPVLGHNSVKDMDALALFEQYLFELLLILEHASSSNFVEQILLFDCRGSDINI